MFFRIIKQVGICRPPKPENLPERAVEWVWRNNQWVAAYFFESRGSYVPSSNQILPPKPSLKREYNQEDAIKELCEDWANDHTHLQNLCREVGYSEEEVEGNSYYVPDITELGDMLRAKIKK